MSTCCVKKDRFENGSCALFFFVIFFSSMGLFSITSGFFTSILKCGGLSIDEEKKTGEKYVYHFYVFFLSYAFQLFLPSPLFSFFFVHK